MLRHFRQLSINAKLIVLIALPSCMVVTLAMGAMVINELAVFHRDTLHRLTGVASNVASTAAAHIIAGHQQELAEELSVSFEPREDLVEIAVYDEQGIRLAYERRAPSTPPARLPNETFSLNDTANLPSTLSDYAHMLRSGQLSAYETILNRGAPIGTVLVTAHTGALNAAVWRYIYFAGALLFSLGVVLAFLFLWLRRFIFDPIGHLITVLDQMTQCEDFSARANLPHSHQIGMLNTKLNELLDLFQQREQFNTERSKERDQHIEALTATLTELTQLKTASEPAEPTNPSSSINRSNAAPSLNAAQPNSSPSQRALVDDGANKQHRSASPERMEPLAGRVLVAGNFQDSHDEFLKSVRSFGLSVATAATGWETLATLERMQCDLALLSCTLPDLNGIKTTTIIRRRELELQVPISNARPTALRLPIIGLTKQPQSIERQDCLAAGMDDYIDITIDRREIYQSLARSLSKLTPSANTEQTPPSYGHSLAIGAQTTTSLTHSPVIPKFPKEHSPMSNSTSNGLLDQQALDNIRALQRPGSRVFEKVVGIYLKDSPSAIAEMESALRAGDAKRIAHLAHRLKSGSANLGATALAETFRELETLCRDGSCDGAAALVARAKDDYARVATALHHELQVALVNRPDK